MTTTTDHELTCPICWFQRELSFASDEYHSDPPSELLAGYQQLLGAVHIDWDIDCQSQPAAVLEAVADAAQFIADYRIGVRRAPTLDYVPMTEDSGIPSGQDNYVPTHVNGVWMWPDEDLRGIYTVVMELQVDASSPEEASGRAMRWRDAIGMAKDTNAALDALFELGFRFHLHHPNGC